MLRFIALLFSACLVHQTANAGDLNLRFAYQPAGENLVQVQGFPGDTGLAAACSKGDAKCTCEFQNGGRSLTAVPAKVSTGATHVNCSVSRPERFSTVRVNLAGVRTPKVEIKKTLTLEELLGDLDPNYANRVYKYSCQRTFFEGEGASPYVLSCNQGQRLGIITARYSYYLYDNQFAGNRGSKFTSSNFGSICGRPEGEFTRYSCNGAPEIRFGLYDSPAGPFKVRVYMTKAPQGQDLSAPYGFAAMVDNSGNCAPGFVKARPYQALPESITEGSIPGQNNPPSSFVNTGDGALADNLIDTAQPENFRVIRLANSQPCSVTNGSCANANFGSPTQVQSVSYQARTPVVCVIPKALIEGRVIGRVK
ncbi:MAG: hypothetical protein ACXWQO_00060 [Bdellovibrionota bacterium]